MHLGDTARDLRETFGLTQRAAADRLGISYVHLCNIEHNKSRPSPELMQKYRDLFGVDLYVYWWCTAGDAAKLPPSMREVTQRLAGQWRKVIDDRRRRG
jgi:transcriptional regulator with XRE-family HTH domain